MIRATEHTRRRALAGRISDFGYFELDHNCKARASAMYLLELAGSQRVRGYRQQARELIATCRLLRITDGSAAVIA